MIQLTPQMRILVAVESVDFRRGINGLCGLCRRAFRLDPLQGAVFVFRNRPATAFKLLVYDGQGFWLCHKRLSQGRFHWWPRQHDAGLTPLAVHELQLLLWNGNRPTCGRTKLTCCYIKLILTGNTFKSLILLQRTFDFKAKMELITDKGRATPNN